MIRAALMNYAKLYGPYAYGTLTVVVGYWGLIRPMYQDNQLALNAQRDAAIALQATASKLTDFGNATRDTAQTQRFTATALDRTSERLERLYDRIDASKGIRQ